MRIAAEMRREFNLNHLAAMRLAHGWNQREMANLWNRRWPDDRKTNKTISYWERWSAGESTGHAPMLSTLARLAELFECALPDLLGAFGDFRHYDRAGTGELVDGHHQYTLGQTCPHGCTVLAYVPAPNGDGEHTQESIRRGRLQPRNPDHLPGEEVTAMRPGVDDGGVLILVHDGQSWGLWSLAGGVAFRNSDLDADDAAGACAWAHETVSAIADVPPPRPNNSIIGVRCYTLNERDGRVVADISPGVVHPDGRSWVAVDPTGEIIDRRTDIAEGDVAAANEWAHEIIISRPGYRPTDPNLRPTTGGPIRYFDYYGSANTSTS